MPTSSVVGVCGRWWGRGGGWGGRGGRRRGRGWCVDGCVRGGRVGRLRRRPVYGDVLAEADGLGEGDGDTPLGSDEGGDADDVTAAGASCSGVGEWLIEFTARSSRRPPRRCRRGSAPAPAVPAAPPRRRLAPCRKPWAAAWPGDRPPSGEWAWSAANCPVGSAAQTAQTAQTARSARSARSVQTARSARSARLAAAVRVAPSPVAGGAGLPGCGQRGARGRRQQHP